MKSKTEIETQLINKPEALKEAVHILRFDEVSRVTAHPTLERIMFSSPQSEEMLHT